MREVAEFVVVSVPLRGDAEERRWYSEGAEACIVLTRQGRLLEPQPIFGPQSYRLLAHDASVREAVAYARTYGFTRQRIVARGDV